MENLLEIRTENRKHIKGQNVLFERVVTNVYDFKVTELHRFFLPNKTNHIAYYRVIPGEMSKLYISKSFPKEEQNLIYWLSELSNIDSSRIGGF